MYDVFYIKREVRFADGSFRSTTEDDLFFYKTDIDMNRDWAQLNMNPVERSSLCSNRRTHITIDAAKRQNTVVGFIKETLLDDGEWYWTSVNDLFVFHTIDERDRAYESMLVSMNENVRLVKFEKSYVKTHKRRQDVKKS